MNKLMEARLMMKNVVCQLPCPHTVNKFIYVHEVHEKIEKALECADERAAEREMKMRKMELELKSKMRETEDQREKRILSMFASMMQQLLTQPPMPPTYTAQLPPTMAYGTQTQTFNEHSSD